MQNANAQCDCTSAEFTRNKPRKEKQFTWLETSELYLYWVNGCKWNASYVLNSCQQGMIEMVREHAETVSMGKERH